MDIADPGGTNTLSPYRCKIKKGEILFMAEQTIPDEITIIPMPTQVEPGAGYDPLLDEEGGNRTSRAITARLSELKGGLTTFLSQVDTLLKDTATATGEFALEEVELSAGVTASGGFVLFGVGAEGALEGGIRFLFRRSVRHQEHISS